MTKQRSHLQNDLTLETWKEELSRAKKYKEATQKRTEEKQVKKQLEKGQQRNAAGRLDIEH